MKGIFPRALCLAAMAAVLTLSAGAYVYTDDPITDPNEYRTMRGLETQIMGSDAVSQDSASRGPSLALDRAVRVYPLPAQAFVDHAADGTLGSVRDGGSYCWEVPISLDEETGGYRYASFGYLSDGSFEYVTRSADDSAYHNMDYLFYPEETLELLYNGGVSQGADIYVVSLKTLRFPIVVAEDDGTFWAVPFAARPDLMDVENGVVTTPKQLAAKIASYQAAESEPLSGGGAGGHTTAFLWILAGIAVLCGAVCCFYRMRRSKHRNRT